MTKLKAFFIDASKTMYFHAGLVFVWICLVPPTLIFWSESIMWVLILSLWANIASHWAAFQASHAEKMEQSGLDNEDLDVKLDRVIALLEDRQPPVAEKCL